LEVSHPVGGNVPCTQLFRVLEKIALKLGKSASLRHRKVLPGFDFLRQHAALLVGIAQHHGRTVFRGDLLDVDFDEVGIRDEGLAGVTGHKLSSAIRYPPCLSRWHTVMTASSAGTDSWISTTTSGGNRAKYSINNIWCVQSMKAACPSHNTSSPIKLKVSMMAQATLSISEEAYGSLPSCFVAEHLLVGGENRVPSYAG
jgi:hypothetical protein